MSPNFFKNYICTHLCIYVYTYTDISFDILNLKNWLHFYCKVDKLYCHIILREVASRINKNI